MLNGEATLACGGTACYNPREYSCAKGHLGTPAEVPPPPAPTCGGLYGTSQDSLSECVDRTYPVLTHPSSMRRQRRSAMLLRRVLLRRDEVQTLQPTEDGEEECLSSCHLVLREGKRRRVVLWSICVRSKSLLIFHPISLINLSAQIVFSPSITTRGSGFRPS